MDDLEDELESERSFRAKADKQRTGKKFFFMWNDITDRLAMVPLFGKKF